jgi:hypothetical protein
MAYAFAWQQRPRLVTLRVDGPMAVCEHLTLLIDVTTGDCHAIACGMPHQKQCMMQVWT